MHVYGKSIVQITKTIIKRSCDFIARKYENREPQRSVTKRVQKVVASKMAGLLFRYNKTGKNEVAAPSLKNKMTCVQ